MRFLCASNLHLGRRIAGLPDHAGVDPARLSAAATWNRLCNAAVTYDVDAVLLAGDVIDRENPLFEPAGALQQGLGVLEREGIPVVMIAGDEDFESLPRAVEMLNSPVVTLLGPDRPSIDINDNGDHATVIGISQNVATGIRNVLANVRDLQTDHPTVVMLHGSLTDGHAPPGTFQPVQMEDLATSHTDLWILGAQHDPDVIVEGDTTAIEPGATFPMEPHETGIHGATLVELFDEGGSVCELIPLSPIQFADIDLELIGTEDLEAVESAIVRAMYDTLDDALATNAVASLATVPCTVYLTGSTPLHAELPSFLDELSRTLAISHQGVSATLHDYEIDTRPQVELKPLLGRPDPVGELARLLSALDDDGEPTPAQEALIQRAVDRLVGVHRSRVFAGVAHDSAPDEEIARMALRREAWNVLDALVRQRGVEV